MRKVLTIVLALLVLASCTKPASEHRPAGDATEIGFASQYNRTLIEGIEALQQQDLKLQNGACRDCFAVGNGHALSLRRLCAHDGRALRNTS